jgi:hypothetical protein
MIAWDKLAMSFINSLACMPGESKGCPTTRRITSIAKFAPTVVYTKETSIYLINFSIRFHFFWIVGRPVCFGENPGRENMS